MLLNLSGYVFFLFSLAVLVPHNIFQNHLALGLFSNDPLTRASGDVFIG